MKPNGMASMVLDESKSRASLRIAGVIRQRYGDWDTNACAAADVVKEIQGLPASVKTLVVELNSVGGSVFEGVEIYQALKGFKGAVEVNVVGIAASIASVILCAGSVRRISKLGQVMIHEPTSYAYGTAADMDSTAQQLRNIEDQVLDLYAEVSTLDRSKLEAAMRKTTFYSAADAVKFGFCTELMDVAADAEPVPEQKMIDFCGALAAMGLPQVAVALLDKNHAPQGAQETETMTKDQVALLAELKSTFGADKALELISAKPEAKQLSDFSAELAAQAAAEMKRANEAEAKLKTVETELSGAKADVAKLQEQVKTLGQAPVVLALNGQDPSKPEKKPDAPKLTGQALAEKQWADSADLRAEFAEDKDAFLAWAKNEGYPETI